MSNPFIPYGRQDINKDDIKQVVKILKSDYITQGPIIEKFEKAISKIVKSRHSVACNSATSALHIACMALGLKEGERLWTTPITFVASANCGLYCGAVVDFVDIDPDTGLLCCKELEKKLKEAKSSGTLPRVLVPVHLAGTSCDMPKIYELSKQYGFSIIEDASHAIGGDCNNYPVGSCKYSDITVFSLHPVKIITSAEGGIATTNNFDIANKMKYLRSHGIVKDKNLFINKPEGSWSYEQQYLGYNYRMSEVHAALGLNQLKRLETFINKRNQIIKYYKDNISHLPLKFLCVPKNVRSSYHLAIIRLNNKDSDFHSYIFDNLRKENIGVQVHYTPVHLQPYYKNEGYSQGDFPKSEEYSRNAITLPIFPTISKESINRVISVLGNLLK